MLVKLHATLKVYLNSAIMRYCLCLCKGARGSHCIQAISKNEFGCEKNTNLIGIVCQFICKCIHLSMTSIIECLSHLIDL